MMFPSTIHSVITHTGNSFGETPSTGRTFGWERRLQVTISWNKRCYEWSATHTTRKITRCEPASSWTDYRLCRHGTLLCTHGSHHGSLSKHRRTLRKRTRCRLPSRCCPIVRKNAAGWSAHDRLSGGCERSSYEGQAPCSEHRKPVQWIKWDTQVILGMLT